MDVAPALRTHFKPRNLPGLFRFQLRHAHRPELGVLSGPTYLRARHHGGPSPFTGTEMQSANYVPGVTGWKVHDGVRLELNDGNRRIYAEVKMITTAGPGQTNDEAAQSIRESADVVAVERLTTRVVEPAKALLSLSSRVTGQGDNLSAADMSGYITGEKPARQAAEQLRRQEAADIAAARRINALSAYDGDLAVAVRQVIREELKPGGMLHRD